MEPRSSAGEGRGVAKAPEKVNKRSAEGAVTRRKPRISPPKPGSAETLLPCTMVRNAGRKCSVTEPAACALPVSGRCYSSMLLQHTIPAGLFQHAVVQFLPAPVGGGLYEGQDQRMRLLFRGR